jgi:hypothetical protein
MSGGITLKDAQRLFGAGIYQDVSTTLGTISIPPQDNGFPLITHSAGAGVTLANNNLVSGIHIDGTNLYGIYGLGVKNAKLLNNIITQVSAGSGDPVGIDLEGPGLSGSYVLENNLITGTSDLTMHGIFVLPQGSDQTLVYMTNNSIQVPKDAVEMKTTGSSFLNSTLIGNRFEATESGGNGFYFKTNDTSQQQFNVNNNLFISAHETGLWIETHDDGSSINGAIAVNQFLNSDEGLKMESRNLTTLRTNVFSNLFSNNTTRDFFAKTHELADSEAPSQLCVSLSSNSAPTHNFQISKDYDVSILNVTQFTNNVGTLVDVGTYPFTQLPVCPSFE